jgi:hypothetical protein
MISCVMVSIMLLAKEVAGLEAGAEVVTAAKKTL